MSILKKKFRHAMICLRTNAMIQKQKLWEQDGQFVMDSTILYVIAITLGAIALVLLANYLKDDLSVLIREKISGFFNVT